MHTVHLLQKPFVCPASQLHVRGSIGEAVRHIYHKLAPHAPDPRFFLLTNIREVLQNRALHRQFVEISIQKGGDALWQRGSFIAHGGGRPEAPVCGRHFN